MVTILLGASFLATSPACRANPPAALKSPDANARPMLLSTAMPPLLAKFVLVAGSDRELSDTPAEMLEQLRADLARIDSIEVDATAVIATLRPKRTQAAFGPATIVFDPIAPGPAEEQDVVVSAGKVVLISGEVVRFNERLVPGTRPIPIRQGALLNAGKRPFRAESAGKSFAVQPGEALVVLERDDLAESAGEVWVENATSCDSCSVNCTVAGYCACCKHAGIFLCASCKCYPCTSMPSCGAGGEGAISCSVGEFTGVQHESEESP
jgi:hypothetical protein